MAELKNTTLQLRIFDAPLPPISKPKYDDQCPICLHDWGSHSQLRNVEECVKTSIRIINTLINHRASDPAPAIPKNPETWAEFKAAIETLDVKDGDALSYIDWSSGRAPSVDKNVRGDAWEIE